MLFEALPFFALGKLPRDARVGSLDKPLEFLCAETRLLTKLLNPEAAEHLDQCKYPALQFPKASHVIDLSLRAINNRTERLDRLPEHGDMRRRMVGHGVFLIDFLFNYAKLESRCRRLNAELIYECGETFT